MVRMPVFAAALLAASRAAAAPGLPPAGDPGTARGIAVVSSIPLAVDLAACGLAEAAFAPEVVIDCTSLWGGGSPRP
jgi:hypothetical protein